jgi:hypothetical protein
MTTITLNTESLFKDILAAFDTMNRETPLNRFLVDLGRHQTLVLKEMVTGQLPHLMAEQSEEVKKLEKQMAHLLNLSKLLLQNIEPDKFVNGVGLSVVMITREMWDDFQKLIADIEGEK